MRRSVMVVACVAILLTGCGKGKKDQTAREKEENATLTKSSPETTTHAPISEDELGTTPATTNPPPKPPTKSGTRTNPEYLAWVSFAPGSKASYEVRHLDGTSGRYTDVLKTLTEEKVVIERITSESDDSHPKSEGMDIAANGEPSDMLDQEGAREVLEQDIRTLQVAGQSFKCQYTRVRTKGDIQAQGQTWKCSEVPGGVVRRESILEKLKVGENAWGTVSGGTATMVLTDFKAVGK